ncbi:MAG: S41 family peptidase [Rikenellaceae bacterium]
MYIKSIIAKILLAIVVCSATSCRKESPIITDSADLNLTIGEEISILFYEVWHSVNQNYLFWDIDPTDWDNVYAVYKPQFDELDDLYIETANSMPEVVTSSNTTEWNNANDRLNELALQCGELLSEMCSTILDHHFNISTQINDVSITVRPSETRKVEELGYMKVMEYFDLYNNSVLSAISSTTPGSDPDLTVQLDKKYTLMSEPSCYYTGDDFYIYSALYDDGVAYLRFSQFSIGTYMYSNEDSGVVSCTGDVLNNYYNLVAREGLEGLIIDLRSNTGGSLSDLSLLTRCLINESESIPFGYYRQKSGLGRLDYSPYIEMAIPASSTGVSRRDLPIAIITDRYSISMAEITPMALREFSDNVQIIGEQTYGATSPLTEHFILGGGIHSDITLRQASVAVVDLNKESHEGYGIEPDIYSELLDVEDIVINGESYTRIKDATDTPFYKAVEYIRSK